MKAPVFLRAIVFFFDVTASLQEVQFQVKGPAGPLVVLAGDDVNLPCYLKPNISAVSMKVEWFRLDPLATVHWYENQKDILEEQIASYRGRTALFKEELQKGNTSLKLTRVQLSDEGIYKCSVATPGWYEEADQLQVSVKGQGLLPVVSIKGPRDWGLELMCESTGWHPEPEVLWLDSEGRVLPSNPSETDRDTDGLYSVRRSAVVQNSDNHFTCRVQQLLINHTLQTEINIPEDLFPKSNIYIIPVCISIIILLLVSVLLYIYHKKRTEKKEAAVLFKKLEGDLLMNPFAAEPTEKQKDRQRLLHVMEAFKDQVSQLNTLKKQLDFVNSTCKVPKSEDIKQYHVDITLDRDTGHLSHLHVEDKCVRYKYNANNPWKFKKSPCVLGREGFPSGKRYFVVEVTGAWILGVVRENVVGRENVGDGAWTLRCVKGNILVHVGSLISLSLTKELKRVGVFVDYEEGLVSFYNATNTVAEHIFSYIECPFQKKVYPFFSFKPFKGHKDELYKMVIVPVDVQQKD